MRHVGRGERRRGHARGPTRRDALVADRQRTLVVGDPGVLRQLAQNDVLDPRRPPALDGVLDDEALDAAGEREVEAHSVDSARAA